jgi:hypothetical protein
MGDMATAVAVEEGMIQEDVAAGTTHVIVTNVIVVVRCLLLTAIADNRRMVAAESVPALYLLQEVGDADYMMRIMRSRPTTSRSKRHSKGTNNLSSAVSSIEPPFMWPEN